MKTIPKILVTVNIGLTATAIALAASMPILNAILNVGLPLVVSAYLLLTRENWTQTYKTKNESDYTRFAALAVTLAVNKLSSEMDADEDEDFKSSYDAHIMLARKVLRGNA